MSTTGFIYLTSEQMNKLFGKPTGGRMVFNHEKLKYFGAFKYRSRNWDNKQDLLIVHHYFNGHVQERRSYVSRNQGIERFIQQHPEIQYDTDEELREIEQDYDNRKDFMNDFHNRLVNMGVGA
jgi:hypothetical protein